MNYPLKQYLVMWKCKSPVTWAGPANPITRKIFIPAIHNLGIAIPGSQIGCQWNAHLGLGSGCLVFLYFSFYVWFLFLFFFLFCCCCCCCFFSFCVGSEKEKYKKLDTSTLGSISAALSSRAHLPEAGAGNQTYLDPDPKLIFYVIVNWFLATTWCRQSRSGPGGVVTHIRRGLGIVVTH